MVLFNTVLLSKVTGALVVVFWLSPHMLFLCYLEGGWFGVEREKQRERDIMGALLSWPSLSPITSQRHCFQISITLEVGPSVYGFVGETDRVAQSCLTLCDPIDGSPSGSSVHESFQARILEWVAISYSKQINRRNKIRNQKVWLC